MERYVFVGNISLDIGERLCVRSVFDICFGLHHVQVTAESGHTLLHHFHQLYQNLDRTDKDADIECVHGQVYHIHSSVGDQITAVDESYQIHHTLEEQVSSGKVTHAFVVGVLGKQEAMVAPGKFLPLNIFIRKGLHNADPGQSILETGVDVPDFTAVIQEGGLHPFILADGKYQHTENQNRQRDCQLPVDHEQENKGSYDLDQGNKQVFRSVMGELCYVEKIRDQLAHHLSGIILGIIGKRKGLVVVEKLCPHIPFHMGAHHMSLVADVVFAEALENIHDEKADGNGKECGQDGLCAPGKQPVYGAS